MMMFDELTMLKPKFAEDPAAPRMVTSCTRLTSMVREALSY